MTTMETSASSELISFWDFFGTSELMCTVNFLNPFREINRPLTGWRRAIGILVYWFIMLTHVLILTGETLFLIEALTTPADLITIASSMVWMIAAIMGTMSAWVVGQGSGRALIDLLREMEKIFPGTRDDQTFARTRECLAEWNAMIMTFQQGFIFTLVTMDFCTLLVAVAGYLYNGIWFFELPMFIWYPFDPYQPRVVVIVYVWELWALTVSTSSIIVLFALLGALITIICMHFDALGRRLRQAKPSYETHAADVQQLGLLIEEHKYLIELSQTIRQLFSGWIFVNYVLSSIATCLYAFAFCHTDDMAPLLVFAVDFLCFCFYSMMYARYGNNLMEHSVAIAYAIYESDWFEGDVRYKKLMIMVMKRAELPMVLTGLDFFVTSYENQRKILTSSYSYFTILRSSYTET